MIRKTHKYSSYIFSSMSINQRCISAFLSSLTDKYAGIIRNETCGSLSGQKETAKKLPWLLNVLDPPCENGCYQILIRSIPYVADDK